MPGPALNLGLGDILRLWQEGTDTPNAALLWRPSGYGLQPGSEAYWYNQNVTQPLEHVPLLGNIITAGNDIASAPGNLLDTIKQASQQDYAGNTPFQKAFSASPFLQHMVAAANPDLYNLDKQAVGTSDPAWNDWALLGANDPITMRQVRDFNEEANPLSQFALMTAGDPTNYLPVGDMMGLGARSALGLGRYATHLPIMGDLFEMSKSGLVNRSVDDTINLANRLHGNQVAPDTLAQTLQGLRDGTVSAKDAAHGMQLGQSWGPQLQSVNKYLGANELSDLAKNAATPDEFYSQLPEIYRSNALRMEHVKPPSDNSYLRAYQNFIGMTKSLAMSHLGAVKYLGDNVTKTQLAGIPIGQSLSDLLHYARNGTVEGMDRLGMPVPNQLVIDSGKVINGASKNVPMMDQMSNKAMAGLWGALGAVSGVAQDVARYPHEPIHLLTDTLGGALAGLAAKAGYKGNMKLTQMIENPERMRLYLDGIQKYMQGADTEAFNPAFRDQALRTIQSATSTIPKGAAGPDVFGAMRQANYLASPKDFEQMLVNAGVDRAAIPDTLNAYRDLQDEAAQAGLAKANKYLFSYDQDTNFTHLIRNFTPFPTWAVNNLPFYLDQIAKRPALGQALADYGIHSQMLTQKMGLGPGYSMKIPLFNLPGGNLWMNLMDPVSIASQLQQPDPYDTENTNPIAQAMGYAEALGFEPLQPIDYGLQSLGLVDRKTDASALNPWTKLAGSAAQALTGYASDPEYLNKHSLLNGMREGWGTIIPSIGQSVAPDTAQDFQVKKRLAEMSVAETGQRWDRNAKYAEAMADPNSDLYRQTAQEMGKEAVALRLANTFLPLEQEFLSKGEVPIRQARSDIYWTEHYGFQNPDILKAQHPLAFTYNSLDQDPAALKQLATTFMDPQQRTQFLNQNLDALYQMIANSQKEMQQGAQSRHYSIQNYLQSHRGPDLRFIGQGQQQAAPSNLRFIGH